MAHTVSAVSPPIHGQVRCQGPLGADQVVYRQLGDTGPWVILLQGLGMAGEFWCELPEQLAGDSSAPSRVLVIDNRGVGGSSAPRGPYTIQHLADDVVAVMDDAGASRATLVGLSMGGMIAQHVALRHPERVEGLVLMATTAGGHRMRPPSIRAVRTLLSTPFARKGGKRGRAREFARLVLPDSRVDEYRELLAVWKPVFDRNPMDPRSFFLQLGAVLSHLFSARPTRIRAPTVVIGAEDDLLIPASNSRALAAAIPGAVLEVLPDVGHGIPLLAPDAVSRALLQLRTRTGRVVD